MTVNTTITGNVGRDAVYKEGQNGKGFVSFPVAGKSGWGDKEQTLWFDVTKWNASPKLAEMLLKGTKVTIIGDQSEREHQGKVYKQITAVSIDVHGRSGAGSDTGAQQQVQPQAGDYDDLDDVPFIGSNSVF